MDMERRAPAKRDQRAKKEDQILNRILIWFGGAVAAEFVLLWLGRYYTPHTTANEIIMLAYHIRQVMGVFVWVALALAAAGGIWLFLSHRKGKKTTLPMALTILFGVAFVMCAVILCLGDPGIQLLCRAVLGVTVLALVFYLYQREFFWGTLVSAVGLLGLWGLRRAHGGHAVLIYSYMAAALVAIVLVVLLCRTMQKNGGLWRHKGREIRLFSKNAAYGLVYLTCAIVAAALAAALIAGAAAAYYLMFALVAWIFVMAVYFTVRLM